MIHEDVSDEGVVTLLLDRPPANTFDHDQTERLDAAISRIEGRGDVSVVVLRASGRLFCGGADIGTLREIADSPDPAAGMAAFVRRLQAVYARLEALPLPTVAVVHGAAMGGGLELALACDFRIVAEDAKLGLPEVRIGMVPGAGGTQRLTRLAGPGLALRLVAAGETVTGAEALTAGLAYAVVPRDQLDAAAAALVGTLAGLPPAAVAAGARCVRLAAEGSSDGFDAEVAAVADLIGRPRSKELFAAFLAR